MVLSLQRSAFWGSMTNDSDQPSIDIRSAPASDEAASSPRAGIVNSPLCTEYFEMPPKWTFKTEQSGRSCFEMVLQGNRHSQRPMPKFEMRR